TRCPSRGPVHAPPRGVSGPADVSPHACPQTGARILAVPSRSSPALWRWTVDNSRIPAPPPIHTCGQGCGRVWTEAPDPWTTTLRSVDGCGYEFRRPQAQGVVHNAAPTASTRGKRL